MDTCAEICWYTEAVTDKPLLASYDPIHIKTLLSSLFKNGGLCPVMHVCVKLTAMETALLTAPRYP